MRARNGLFKLHFQNPKIFKVFQVFSPNRPRASPAFRYSQPLTVFDRQLNHMHKSIALAKLLACCAVSAVPCLINKVRAFRCGLCSRLETLWLRAVDSAKLFHTPQIGQSMPMLPDISRFDGLCLLAAELKHSCGALAPIVDGYPYKMSTQQKKW